jgi:pimeloyl-ACP methyl ester carboxylesterase
MKTVLLIPGNKQGMDTHPYQNLVKNIEKSGYKVKFISIKWTRTTLNDWLGQLDEEYLKLDPANTVLAGFSFGSIIAFAEAAKRPPAELWLFSLSQYFAEDLPLLKDQWKEGIGKRRLQVFSNLRFNELVKNISSKTMIFVGEEELERYPELAYRSEDAHTKIPGSKFIVAKGVGHEVTHPNYIKAIVEAIKLR